MSDRFECAAASLQRDESLAGTASVVRSWLLIEVRGAWGPQAIHDSELGQHIPRGWKNHLAGAGTRAICIRSDLRRDADDVRLFHVLCARPGSGALPTIHTTTVDSLADVVAATRAVTRQASPADWQPSDQRLALVCTNGRHDQCCANFGRPVVRALRNTEYAEQLWECSHIGGDRFAGNLVILPDGLYFGRCQVDDVGDVLAAHDQGQITLDYFRGRSTYVPAEQMVEHFVRAEYGLSGVDDVVVGRHDGARFAVRTPAGIVDVEIARRMVHQYEALTCKGPVEQDIAQFELVSINPRRGTGSGAAN